MVRDQDLLSLFQFFPGNRPFDLAVLHDLPVRFIQALDAGGGDLPLRVQIRQRSSKIGLHFDFLHPVYGPDLLQQVPVQRVVLHQIHPGPVRVHLVPLPAVHGDLIIPLKLLLCDLLRIGAAKDGGHCHEEDSHCAQCHDGQDGSFFIPGQVGAGQFYKTHLCKSLPLFFLLPDLSLIPHGFHRRDLRRHPHGLYQGQVHRNQHGQNGQDVNPPIQDRHLSLLQQLHADPVHFHGRRVGLHAFSADPVDPADHRACQNAPQKKPQWQGKRRHKQAFPEDDLPDLPPGGSHGL